MTFYCFRLLQYDYNCMGFKLLINITNISVMLKPNITSLVIIFRTPTIYYLLLCLFCLFERVNMLILQLCNILLHSAPYVLNMIS